MPVDRGRSIVCQVAINFVGFLLPHLSQSQ